MTLYNYSNLSTATGPVDMIRFLNAYTNDQFGLVLFIITATILFIAMKVRYPVNTSFAVSGYVTAVIAILFRVANIIGDKALIIALIAFGAGTFALFIGRNNI